MIGLESTQHFTSGDSGDSGEGCESESESENLWRIK